MLRFNIALGGDDVISRLSGHVSGLGNHCQNELRSSSDSNLFNELQRLKTAVSSLKTDYVVCYIIQTIAKGRRQFQYGSETYLVPSAEETIVSTEGSATSLIFQSSSLLPSSPLHNDLSNNDMSQNGLSNINSSHVELSQETNLRASIQKFDQRRTWINEDQGMSIYLVNIN